MSAAPGLRPNPYIGPRAFRRDDGHLFFGRERELQKLLNLITSERIVLLHSPSGAGKSSLINAALIPALEKDKFRVLPVMRVNRVLPPTAPEGPSVANRYVFSSLLSLEECLPKKLRMPLEKLTTMSLADYLKDMGARRKKVELQARLRLREALRMEGEAASRLTLVGADTGKARALLGDGGLELMRGMARGEVEALLGMDDEEVSSQFEKERGRTPFVLIFDQFEEVLTVDLTDQPAKHEFFKQVGEALYDDMLWAVFSMREDYVAALQPYVRPVPTRLGTRFRLNLLTVDHAHEAIRKPAAGQKVDFTEEAATKLSDDLRTVKVQGSTEVARDEKGDFVEPMQLQVVCYRLWQRLQFPDDDAEMKIKPEDMKGGDVNQALAGFYDDCVRQVAGGNAPQEKRLRDWVEENLITPGGTRGMVYMGETGAEGVSRGVVEKLQDLYLLRSEYRAGAYWFELTHDRFIGPIRESNGSWMSTHILAARVARARYIAAVWFMLVFVLWVGGLETVTPTNVKQIVVRELRKNRLAEVEVAIAIYEKITDSGVATGDSAPYRTRDWKQKQEAALQEFKRSFDLLVDKYYPSERKYVTQVERADRGKGKRQRRRRRRRDDAVPAPQIKMDIAERLRVAKIHYGFLKWKRQEDYGWLYNIDSGPDEQAGALSRGKVAKNSPVITKTTLMLLPVTCGLMLLGLTIFLTANRSGIVTVVKEVLKERPEDEGDGRNPNWLSSVLRPSLGADSPKGIHDALGWNVASRAANVFTLLSLIVILAIQLRVAWVGAKLLRQLGEGEWMFGLAVFLYVMALATFFSVNVYLRTGLRQAYAAGVGKGEQP